jgi:AraC family transcriptional regulator
MPHNAHQKYLTRIERVRAHISDHLDAPLDLDTLAEVACLSRFHWSRVYQAMTGETPVETVRRLRLDRAARDLARGDTNLGAIATRAGYASQSSFSRAFAEAFGSPPGEFREKGPHAALTTAINEFNPMAFPVEILTLPRRASLTLEHCGPYHDIGQTFGSLFMHISAAGLSPKVRGMFGQYTDDPKLVAPADLRSQACAFMDEAVSEPPAPLRASEAGGGLYAVLHYRGPYSAMQPAYDWLLGVWLPASGRTPRDAPILEINLNSPMDTAPGDLLTDICFPVED